MRGKRIAAVFILVAVAACGSARSAIRGREDPANAKVGAGPGPLIVTIADSQPAGRPTNLAAEYFAAEVARRSGGDMAVKVVTDADVRGSTFDDSVIAAVEEGRFDLATIPTRAWKATGVDSMGPLQAPFEVLSQEHMAAIVGDDNLVSRMFAGLKGVGLHGLVLLPESLRLVFSFGAPIVAVDDFRGLTLRSITPNLGDGLRGLGVEVRNPPDQAFGQQVADGEIGAAETDFLRASDDDTYDGATATADAALYAKFVSLVVNDQAWSALTDGQRQVIEDSAVATRVHAIATMASQDDQAAAFCERNEGTVVLAGEQAVAALRQAVGPGVAELDPTAIAAIRALAPQRARPVSPCKSPHALDAGNVRRDGGGLPNGRYRLEWSAAFMADWNASHDQPGAIRFRDFELKGAPATLTWTLVDGHYTFEIAFTGEPRTKYTGGVYQVSGDEMLLKYIPDVGAGVNRLRWSVGADGGLSLQQIDDRARDPYFGVPWVRIGDASAADFAG